MRKQRVRRTAGNRVSAKPPARPRERLQLKGTAVAKAAVTALLVGLGSATALGEASLGVAMAAAQQQIDALRNRSPGTRTEANLTKGKPRALAAALPARRDARSSVAAPGAAPASGPVAGLLPAPAGVAAPILAAPVPAETGGGAILPGAVPGGGGVFAGGGGGFFPPTGGLGGGIGGGGGVAILPPGPPGTGPGEETPPVTLVPPPAPAPIPEPGPWALMILGFGIAGTMVRRRAQSVPCVLRVRT